MPNALTEKIDPPLLPDPMSATDADIARFILKQEETLERANARLQAIRDNFGVIED